MENNITNIGIYEIRCTITNKVYIGSSKQIKKRLAEHKNELRKNKHCNSCLQGVWNKYGENAFEFSCIKNLNKNTTSEELLVVEQQFLDKIQPWKRENGFNLNPTAFKPPYFTGKDHPMYGRNHTTESKEKMKGPRPNFKGRNTGKTMQERLGRDWVNPLKGTTRDGWISPCKGKLRPDWNSPCKNLTAITLKNINGSIKTQTSYDWAKQNVKCYYITSITKKFGSSCGWYFCPFCCVQTNKQNCICESNSVKKLKRKLTPIVTLKHLDGTVDTKIKLEWVSQGVNVYDLVNNKLKNSNGWSLYFKQEA